MFTAKKARAKYERREKIELIGFHLSFTIKRIRLKLIEIRLMKFITRSVKKAVKEKKTSIMIWFLQPFDDQERRKISTTYKTMKLIKLDEICRPYTEAAFFQNVILLDRFSERMGYSLEVIGKMEDNPQKRTQYQYRLKW